MVLIADPQLIDAHTYPRRGIVLELTVFYTDLFMSKSYHILNKILMPQSIVFLGDLFDGGREWSTDNPSWANHKADPRGLADWANFDRAYWEAEYVRFNQVFPPLPGRRIIRSMPGNHDLGFGNGVNEGVRSRFKAFFGETSSVHTFGNHTFVLIDAPSLENTENKNIYEPPRRFLEEFADTIPPTEEILNDKPKLRSPVIEEAGKHPAPKPTASTLPQLPRVLLTHVPLYRLPNTPCGPLRQAGAEDALAVRGGFQYQNVMTYENSGDMLRKIQPVFVASGDDHDYCEVLHADATGMVREVTVTSFSFTMGVAHPGFLMVSLWNPINGNQPSPQDGSTLQTKLCLLPNQAGIYIIYAMAFGIMKFLATLRIIYFWLRRKRDDPILPTTQDEASRLMRNDYAVSSVSSWSGGAAANGNIVSTRTTLGSNLASNSHHHNPHYGGYGIPSNAASPAPYSLDDEEDKYAKRHNQVIPGISPNLQHNINIQLTQLGNAAGNMGSLVADRVVERVPSLAPMVENGRELVRREIKSSGGWRGCMGKLWRTVRHWSVAGVVVGAWYLYLIWSEP